MRLVVYVGLCVGLSGAACGPWREPEGPLEVLGRRWRVLRWFRVLGVTGESLGGPWGSLVLPGWSLGVPGRFSRGFWVFLGPCRVPAGVLGAPLRGPWGAYRSLGGPGVSSGVHGGFLELVIFCFWEVNLMLV